MDRPYIICHMSTSLDGKITGSYMETAAAQDCFEEYERVNQFYQPQAWINGRITVDDNFTFYEKPELAENVPPIPHEDYVAFTGKENYLIAADPSGRLGWKENYVEYAGRPKAYVIEILTEAVSDAYLDFLQKKHISYLFAGNETIDFTLAVQKLKSLFGIERLKLSGGGVLNWSFANEGLIDELSLLVAPVADGDTTTPTLFERSEKLPFHGPVSFALKSVEEAKGGCAWLRYTARKEKNPK